ncbi:hypothetical protein Baya_15012 [Bagarius yarrelli]|uniref:Uncharacterized protein n=1 Tax=Bagarius yarrelli TaxID=175774 RepID=A0A556VAM9_BAGYA|nr:hypothetical protein Baya_15012 [Bagarius yarrelli]
MPLCPPRKFVIANWEREAMVERYSQLGKAGTWAANQGKESLVSELLMAAMRNTISNGGPEPAVRLPPFSLHPRPYA